MKVLPSLPLLCCLTLVAVSCQERETVREEATIEKTIDPDMEPGMVHTVYFWLKDDLDAEAVSNFETGVARLEDAPSVKRILIGQPAPTESRDVVDNSFDYSLVLWFDDVAGHDAYQTDPVHLQFVEEQGDKFAKVEVKDNVALIR